VTERVDYVVVGAGVVGSAVAWELARAGREVVVLESNTVAGGASGGIGKRGIRTNGRDRRELPLMRRAHELWPALADAIDAPTGFERAGHLQLLDGRDDPVAAQAQVEDQSHAGDRDHLRRGRGPAGARA
jgi:sarcosine oxidase subunit beta